MNNEKYLVVNCGSSSVKSQLIEVPASCDKKDVMKKARLISKINVERIGELGCNWTIKTNGQSINKTGDINNHIDAVKTVVNELKENNIVGDLNEITAVGNRVLHGGETYKNSVLIDYEVIENIKKYIDLGPLHQPKNLEGIECIKEMLDDVPQVAVFDTAFHQTIPMRNFLYPIPLEYYEKYGVRKYGFHGTSVHYIVKYMQEKLVKRNINLIVCHIGSGASITAVKDGKSYDTSMGLTPLDGLMMGTRSGSIDPSIIDYLKRVSGKKTAELNKELNEKSGFYGIAGKNDFRDIEKMAAAGDKHASIALDMFILSVSKYISQYYSELEGKIDAIVFTAGIGENSNVFRKLVVDELKRSLGIVIDDSANDAIGGPNVLKEGLISSEYSKYKMYVVPTNEELMIMYDTYKIVHEKEKTLVKSR